MTAMGWGEAPDVPGLRDERSTGSPSRDLQTGFDWGLNHQGFDHWDQIYRDVKEWEDNRIVMQPKTNLPTSYHDMCLFRVTGYVKDDGDEILLDGPLHFVGIKRGDHWLHRGADGALNRFEHAPVVDAWAYID